jgi:hypothetical protein
MAIYLHCKIELGKKISPLNSVKKQPEKTSLKIDYCDRYENIGARPEIIRKKG